MFAFLFYLRCLWNRPYQKGTEVIILDPPNSKHWHEQHPRYLIVMDWCRGLKTDVLYLIKDGDNKEFVIHEKWIVQPLTSELL
jgi:hypothetical protein